jgi:hypothetical protein
MTDKATPHTWVEVHQIVLDKGERAPQVPADTQQVPLEMKVKGFLVGDAAIGEEAEIVTPAGRRLTGRLTAINPAYTHTYGAPIPALSAIGGEVRALLRARGTVQ